MNPRTTKALSLLLALAICCSLLPLQVFAAGGAAPVRLPETKIEEDVLRSDVFYVASPSAQLAEGSGDTYLLRIGRGGAAQEAASVHVRIADLTAKYGEDYTVRVYGTGTAADDPEDNLSLLEMMEAQPYVQAELGTDEELASLLQEDEEGQAVLNEGIQSAVDFLDSSSGLEEKYPDGYPAAETDAVQQARAAFTGIEGTSQRLTAQGDVFSDLQSVADVLTTAVVGADVTLYFAPGVSQQYLELIPRDDREGNGSRMFYLVLNNPEGSTTVSGADSCAVTIVDDEVQEPSVVSFSAAEYSLVPGEESVTVTVERSGAINSVVSAVVRTTGEGSAVAGRDYSEVERSLLFPFGVSALTVEIPVCTSYFTGSADFALSLEAETDCTVGTGAASVTMTGTYSAQTAALLSAGAADEAALMGTTTDRNSLSTVRVLDAIDLSQPVSSGHQDNYYGGNNYYESNNKRWLMEWMDSSIVRDRKGTLGATWQISKDEGRYWLAGAQVIWDRTGSCAQITVDMSGNKTLQSSFSDWQNCGDNASDYNLYRSTANFNKETVNMYPSEWSIRNSYSFSPKWISFYNRGRCDDCNRLWIYSIRPILRPFQILLQPAEPLKFLQPNGIRTADDGTATRASIVNSFDQIVCFLDESFTVTQPSGSNVQQYARLADLQLLNSKGEQIYSFGKNTSAAVKDITCTLTKEKLTNMKAHIGNGDFRDLLKENEFVSNAIGYANYGELNVQPVFDYINSSVTLRNPYDFPVTMVISGWNYTLAAHETKKVTTYHLGDQLALTEIRLTGDAAANYTAVGASVQMKRSGAEAAYESENLNFVNQSAVFLGGSNTGDHRLCCKELIVEPNLQEKSNRIVVRVRTAELPMFDQSESAGLLHQSGTVNGEYTEFVLADPDLTFNGKLYAVSASPIDGHTCLWYDKNTGRSYEGNTLYFTAGAEPARNVITLSAVPTLQSITLCGTLRYMEYNLRTLDSGSASAVPASGAVVAAGSASAVAGEDGAFRTGEIPVSGSSDRYLRYLVSVNGNALVKETRIPVSGGELDLSGNFSDGVSPVSSDIFSGMQITAKYPASSGYNVGDGTYLPIVDGVAATVTVRVRPSDYTVTSSTASGVTEQTRTENPKSVVLAVYDGDGSFKGSYPAADCEYDDFGGFYTATIPVDFAVSSEGGGFDPDEGGAGGDEPGSDEPGGDFTVLPGDRLYLRLTTDRLAQAGSGGADFSYTYSDIYTGFAFIAPTSYEAPVVQGLNSPVNLEYPNLPLIGTAGMNLEFPFVTVGWMKIDRGYRMYIGISPVQIYDSIKGTHTSSFSGDDGVYWGSLFKMGDPFGTFAEGMKAAYKQIKGIGAGGVSTGSLGSPQWRFDLTLGAFFDFYNPTVSGTSTDDAYSGFYFAGVGFYMSAELGFKMAWYFVIPVVFIPAYIGLDITGMVMGFLGAAASGTATVSMDEARHEQVNFNDDLDEFTGSVRGVGIVQLSIGVGLCGTLGIRAVGMVKLIGEYAPSDIVRDWGIYIGINAGITIDLFLFSVPLVFELTHTAFGSFEDYEKGVYDPAEPVPTLTAAQDGGDPFRLRTGSGQDSKWVGSKPALQGALTPASSKVLATDAYERADAQLITLDNGTVVLAFIDSDNAKGPYQRTTLKLASYCNGQWSEPVAVCADDTADFQPSISEAKDGRVLVAWVSTGANDVTDETATADYLRSMEIFAAFAEVGADGSITVGEPTQLTTGTQECFYDSAPTAVCDKVSGDAMVFYIKSGSTTADAAELANPYTNDCTIGYMYYNAEADSDGGRTVPAGWLTADYYSSEYSGETPDVAEWGGQRFLSGPTFRDAQGNTVFYAIPDFTAIGYNGLAVFAYTVDRDSSNDTDSDKELYLQVFNFAQHELKYRIRLTDDDVSDALPQLFRAKDAGISTADENTHTKLFWYRDGRSVCYIDVTRLIQEGINDDGSFVPHEEDTTDAQGRVQSHYAAPHYVGSGSDGSASSQMADFRVAEDGSGSLYVVWSENVSGEDGAAVQQLFAMGMYATPDDYTDEQANDGLRAGSSGWSKPYQLTKGEYSSDEPAVTACGDGLMVVHNSYLQTLNIRENADRFEGVVDYDPIEISALRLTATLMEPCGSVETENVLLAYADAEEDGELAVTLPEGGRDVLLTVTAANNGLTEAAGYKLTLFAVQNGSETLIDSAEISDALMPTGTQTHVFRYTLPANPDGLSFRAVTQEKRSAGGYYADTFTYETEPLECRADYAFSDVETFQTADGFRMRYTLTNNGNAAGSGDVLRLTLNGPFNLDLKFDEAERLLYTGSVGTLAVGESRSYDVPVTVPAEMLEKYGFIDASALIVRTAADGSEQTLSERVSVPFSLSAPMNLSVGSVALSVGDTQTPNVTMELAQLFGGSDVSFAVEDQTVAAVRSGMLVGLGVGTTTFYAIHNGSGATASATVTVYDSEDPTDPAQPDGGGTDSGDTQPEKHLEDFLDLEPAAWYAEGVRYALAKGIMDGMSETLFVPDADTTRAMVVTMLWRLAGEPESGGQLPYADVPEGQWYAEAVRWANETGVVNGVSETSFAPDAPVTREQLVVILCRYARTQGMNVAVSGDPLPFTDADRVSDWAAESMRLAVDAGIINGVAEDLISPETHATRAQVAVIFMRFDGLGNQ